MRRPDQQVESWVESYLRLECEKERAWCVKIQRVATFPDRIIYWWDGVHDLVETKRPVGGRYEPGQLRTHANLRRMGHNVFVINTREQVDEYISMRKPHGRPVGMRIEALKWR